MSLSSPPAASPRRWLERPGNREEWEQLRKALDLAEGFQFFALQMADPKDEIEIETLLREEAGHQERTLVAIDLARPGAGSSRVGDLLDEMARAPRPCWFFLHGASTLADRPGEIGRLFLFLNQKRDVIAERSAAPLLLALHRDEWATFRRSAPDFWSIHQSVFRFGGAGSETLLLWTEEVQARRIWALRMSRRVGAWGEPPDVTPLPALPESADPPALTANLETVRERLVAALSKPGARVLVTGDDGNILVRGVVRELRRSFPEGVFLGRPEESGSSKRSAAKLAARILKSLHPLTDLFYDDDTVLRLFQEGATGSRALIVLQGVEDLKVLDRFGFSGSLSIVATGFGRAPAGWVMLDASGPSRLHLRREDDSALLTSATTWLSPNPGAVGSVADSLAALLELADGQDERARVGLARALSPDPGEASDAALFIARCCLAALDGLAPHLPLLEEAIHAVRQRGERPQLAWMLASLAALLLRLDPGRSERLAEESRRIAQELFLPETEAEALDVLAGATLLRGDARQAESLLEAALRLRLTVHGDSHPAVALTWERIAQTFEIRGEWAKALEIYGKRQLPIYEGLGDGRGRARTYGHLARIHRLLGQLDESIGLRRSEEIPLYDLAEAVREGVIARFHLAEEYLERKQEGDRAEAVRLLQRASRTADALELPEALAIHETLERLEGESS